jgi:hypothetical protein
MRFPHVRNFLVKLLVFTATIVANVIPAAFAATDVGATIVSTIQGIALSAYAIIIPVLLLGLVLGYIQIAGPWGLQMVKKSGRGQVEMGILTLVLFLITPVLIVAITNIAALISGGCTWDTLIKNGAC